MHKSDTNKDVNNSIRLTIEHESNSSENNPCLILSVNASQFNGTCPNNHGGMINDIGGFSCVTTTHGNTTAGVFLHISGLIDIRPCRR